jgi:hypothetical protein
MLNLLATILLLGVEFMFLANVDMISAKKKNVDMVRFAFDEMDVSLLLYLLDCSVSSRFLDMLDVPALVLWWS